MAEQLPKILSAAIILIVGIATAAIISAIVYLVVYLLGKVVGYNKFKMFGRNFLTPAKVLSSLTFIFTFFTTALVAFKMWG